MNWRDVLPEGVADSQAADERRRRIERVLSSKKAMRKEVAERLGVSATRVGQLFDKAQRNAAVLPVCPLHRFLALDPGVRQMAGAINRGEAPNLKAVLGLLAGQQQGY